jgi:hypothetical protein
MGDEPPGAFGRVTSFGTGPPLLATAGLLLIGLLKTPWHGVRRRGDHHRRPYAGAGHSGLSRRPDLCRARRRRQARDLSHRQRYLRRVRMACGRCALATAPFEDQSARFGVKLGTPQVLSDPTALAEMVGLAAAGKLKLASSTWPR